jgi:hypothetical protein|tara:strand:- start:62 stop:418 length:357 start_codon:yes stop_codon:yes gene_type:complete
MTYNWCHGPNCHTYSTQSRVRGSGDNKVLRTIKIKQGRYNGYQNGSWDYFCNQGCLMDFIRTHLTSVVAIAPRREALETPIKVDKEKYESYRYKWTDNGSERVPYMATRTIINTVDND